MMEKCRVFINAILSVVQIVVVGVILYVLYRFLLNTIGVEQLGIWSLVLATTSVTQIANLGLCGSVVKYVAKYAARGEDKNVSEVLQTTAISLAVIIGFVLLAGYPVIKWVLSLVVPLNSLEHALIILPFALFSLWLTTITSVFQSGLDGFQRIYIRNCIMMGSSVFFALLCFMIAPKNGLIGLAYAQIINNSLVLIVSWILIKKFLPVLPVIPYKWNKNLFKEIVGYGVNFQVINITAMLYDPITKALLSKFGGLSMVGYYEMASRMAQHFRALIVSANQVLIPAIADLDERNPERIRSVYLTSYNLLFYLALPLYTLIIVSIPLISEIWIGHYERVFVIFGILLSIGWFINTLNAPAYFVNLGTGNLRWNVIGHLIIGFLNAGFGIILGLLFNGFGVVVAWVIALSLGTSVIYISFHLNNKIPLSELFPRDSRIMFLFYTIISIISLIIQYRFNQNVDAITLNVLLILTIMFIIFIPFYLHPMRKRLIGWANELLSRKAGV